MANWFDTIDDWDAGREELRRRRYGVIETSGGRLAAVHLRPWPTLISWPEIWPVGREYHLRGIADRCLVYYNQPRGHSNFLALKYVVSTRGTAYATVRAALAALDALAELKHSDALLCDAANTRLSDQMLRRLGWEAHRPQAFRRNFIKRFYGTYPQTVGVNPAACLEAQSVAGACFC